MLRERRERIELNAIDVDHALFFLDVAARARRDEDALRLLLQAKKALERVLFDLQQLILTYQANRHDD